jgi:hypothetical protein
MMIERIALDFRCASCSMIRRVDGNLACTVASHLPTGWHVQPDYSVICDRCCAQAEATDVESDEGYMKVATESLYRSPEGQGRHAIPRPDKPMDPHRQKRADERREAIKDVHLAAASTTDPEAQPFSARGRTSGDLTPPTTQAPVPAYNEVCPDCHTGISETDAWVPDFESGSFMRVHRACKRARPAKE